MKERCDKTVFAITYIYSIFPGWGTVKWRVPITHTITIMGCDEQTLLKIWLL